MAMEKKTVDVNLPPGFRFHPTDQELILHYLRKKVAKIPLPASIVNDIELYRYDPWDLPKESTFGDDEWYFFTPRDRKYPNGMRPNRMVASGYWKATGIDKPILSTCGSKVVGVKKALVFYTGRPPKGNKTNWIMLEYRLPDLEVPWPIKREKSMRLDDWVLCRIRQKAGIACNMWEERKARPTPITELHLPVQYLPAQLENQEALLDLDNNIKHEEMVRQYVGRNNNTMLPGFSFHMPPPSMDQSVNSSTITSVSEDYSLHNYDMGKRKHDMEMELGYHDYNKKANIMINTDVHKMETATPTTTTTIMNNVNFGIYNNRATSYDVDPSGPAGVVYQDIYSLAFASREIFLENDI